MQNRLGVLSASEIISHVTMRLKEYTSEDIPPLGWIELINAKVNSINALMSTTDKSVYQDSQVLTPIGSQGGLVLTSEGLTYTKTTKSLYIPAACFSGGDFSTSVTSCLLIPIGSLVIFYEAKDNVGGDNVWSSIVESIPDATHLILRDDFGSNLTTGDFRVAVFFGDTSSNDITISGFSCYKFIDQILSIYDSGIADECINAKTISNFFGMKKKNLSYTYKNSIIYVRQGENLKFAKGLNISSYGTRTMYFSRSPYPIAVESDLIDIPQAYMDMIFKLLMLDGLQTIKVPIPQELQSAQQQMKAMQIAKDKEIATLLQQTPDN